MLQLLTKSGTKVCIEYKCVLEVLANQSKFWVSKAQAKLIFQRENPNFKTSNYSNAVNSNKGQSNPASSSSSNHNQGQSNPASSRTSNTSYIPTTRQSFQLNTPREYLKDDEKTSQNNPVVRLNRKEYSKIFSWEKKMMSDYTKKNLKR